MSNKSYNEIVSTCKLIDYKLELAANARLWVEYWQDEKKEYRALFSETGNSAFPLTYFTKDLNVQTR